VRRLLRHRDARLLVAGQTLSVFGDRAMFLALGVWVKELTGSSAAAGLVFFAYTAPGLISPLYGAVVDRVRARRLMIALNVAGAVVLIPLLGVHGHDRLWLIYVVTLVYGAIGWMFYSAQSAYLTRLLPPELLGDANATLQATGEGMRLFAPLAGAGLFAAFGGPTVAALDAATFVVAALALVAVRHREARPAPSEHHLRAQVAAGARHIGASPGLLRIVTATAVVMLVVGFTETLVFSVLQHSLHRPPAFFGVLSSAQGLGAVGGGVVAGLMLRRHGDGRVMGLGMLLFAAGAASMLVPQVGVVLAGFVVAGCGVSWAVVGYTTAVQLRTPAALQGRVSSAADVLVGVPQTISVALGAGLIGIVDYRMLIVVMAAVTVACGAYLATVHLPPPREGLVPVAEAR
jgi:MFS family permease